MSDIKELAKASNAWPFQEALQLVERFKDGAPEKGYVLFETGYGPSGLPHIGTFMEVFRTTLVRRAFEQLSDIPTKLFCISDDMDGLRKVPDNVPNQEMVRENLGKALTSVPDPFGTHESYGAHMNARLCGFLDHYGFEYEFKSSTAEYKAGTYDEKLLLALERYDDIMKVMLPTLGEERASNYSPFMPISPKTGHVLQTRVTERNVSKGTIVYEEEDGTLGEVPVTGGHCKLQWKPDFGMRWAALDVDYEMYGKDHQASAPLYNAICKILGNPGPQQYVYEMFLDAEGKKISKSKGNGISIEQWLRYGPPESLSYYMFQSPRKAKRLYFDVIPRAVDDYQTWLGKFPKEDPQAQVNNPTWHIHNGKPPASENIPGFNLLLNLAGVANVEDPKVLWGFINNYMPELSAQTHPFLDQLVQGAVHYYQDFVKPTKKYRLPDETESEALEELVTYLNGESDEATAEDLQKEIYAIGKKYFPDNLRAWFSCMYETMLGQPQGPRMGSFVALYGRADTIKLIKRVLAKEDLAA
ncbi:MAG: lysine--tRNA ligase [Rickettsiales bacterium]